jgi:hypothetical protein
MCSRLTPAIKIIGDLEFPADQVREAFADPVQSFDLIGAGSGLRGEGADVSIQVVAVAGGIQGLPVMAWWSAVRMSVPCLVAVLM